MEVIKNINHCFKNKRFQFKKIDICKLSPKEKFLKKLNMFFHFAGIGDVVPSIVKPTKYMATNVQGTVNVFRSVKKKQS